MEKEIKIREAEKDDNDHRAFFLLVDYLINRGLFLDIKKSEIEFGLVKDLFVSTTIIFAENKKQKLLLAAVIKDNIVTIYPALEMIFNSKKEFLYMLTEVVDYLVQYENKNLIFCFYSGILKNIPETRKIVKAFGFELTDTQPNLLHSPSSPQTHPII